MRQQARLNFGTRNQTPLSKAAAYDAANLRSAREILEDPERWGGEHAGLVQWARAVVQRLAPSEAVCRGV